MVRQAVHAISHRAESKGVTVHSQVELRVGHLAGDGDRLQRAVWNLLDNAIKFTNRGGSVSISLEPAQMMAKIGYRVGVSS